MTRVPSLDSYTISIDEIDATVNRCRLDKPGRSSSDVVLLSGKGNDIRVLVIKRAKAPFAGCHALPGGHIDEGETSRATAVRELREETSVEINASDLRYLKDYTGVERDPRAQARSSVYFHTLDAELPASASSDAEWVGWVEVSKFTSGELALAFDHAQILADALDAADGKRGVRGKEFAVVIETATRRNRKLLVAVRSRMLVEQSPDRAILLAEYEAMKNETVERIKQRDSFINLNIVAAALIVGFAGSSSTRAAAWLALPWSSICFGWAYLANDEKVTGLSKYFENTVAPQLGPRALAWERSPKRGTNLKRTHKTIQLTVDILQFVAPTAAAIIAYWRIADQPWHPGIVALVVTEGALALALGGLFVAHSHLVKRWNVREDQWQAL